MAPAMPGTKCCMRHCSHQQLLLASAAIILAKVDPVHSCLTASLASLSRIGGYLWMTTLAAGEGGIANTVITDAALVVNRLGYLRGRFPTGEKNIHTR